MERSKIGLQYQETTAFEIICKQMKIEYWFSHYDEAKELNIYYVEIQKGKSGILFDIGKMIENKVNNSN